MRKSVEYNAYELVCSLCLLFPSLSTKGDILKLNLSEIPRLKGCTQIAFDAYKKDLILRKNVEEYIHNFQKLNIIDIESVFLEGKKIKSPEIIHLNKDIDIKCAKADIYCRTISGQYIGLSVKQDVLCTKTNFSVEKIIGELEPSNELSTIRRKVLSKHGFMKHDPTKRSEVNALFYPNQENEYWDSLRKYIKHYETNIKEVMVRNMYPTNLPYKLYEFNGTELNVLQIDMSKITSEEHLPFYLDSHGNTRNAAKLFYILIVGNERYRVEVRWKGNIHNTSPQFLTHKLKN